METKQQHKLPRKGRIKSTAETHIIAVYRRRRLVAIGSETELQAGDAVYSFPIGDPVPKRQP